jgi:hypothetical protein
VALAPLLEPTVNSVRIDVTVPGGHDRLRVSRLGPSTQEAVVRGWEEATVEAGLVIVRDFEAPIGVPLEYTAASWTAPSGTPTLQTGTITIPSEGCSDTWLTDLARAGNTQRVIVEALAELAYAAPSVAHSIIGRRDPIISGDVAHTPTFELSFLTEHEVAREQARACLGNGVPVLLRTPPELGIGNLYFAVMGFAEQRPSSDGLEPLRRWVVNGVQVVRPDPAIYVPLAPVDWAFVEEEFASWQALEDGRASWDALAYDWSGSGPSDIVPWPPADV